MKLLIKPRWLMLLFFLLYGYNATSQVLPDLFAKKVPYAPDTVYYPYYNGMQMIEIDHYGLWQLKKENHQARYSMMSSLPPPFTPPPFSNELFFRDKDGKIIKVFNSRHSLKLLQKRFVNDSIKKRSHFSIRSTYHFETPSLSRNFPGYYRILEVNNSKFRQGKRTKSKENPSFLIQSPFHDNYMNTTNIRDISFGLIDSLGKVTVPVKYQDLFFWNASLLVKQKNKWGVIDKNNRVIFPLVYDQVQIKSNNLLILKKEREHAIAFYKGNIIRLKHYDKTEEAKSYLMVTNNNRMGLLDSTGRQLIPCKYEQIYSHDLDRGFFIVKQNNLCGFIDLKTGAKSKIAFDMVSSYISNDRIAFEQGKLYGFLNAKGKVVIQAKYDLVEPFRGRITPVKKDGKWGFINKKGKLIIPHKYDWASSYWNNGKAKVGKDRLEGLVNDKGKEVVPCEYRYVRYNYKRKIYLFRKDEVEYRLNNSGKIIKDD